jgi:outer membrane protein OmpA-like peptidoglycan-associated protein
LSAADGATILSRPDKSKASMRSFRVLSLTLAAGLCAAPALAQMYPGQGIVVNPGAAGNQVLLYPGGQYMRVVPPLMQPGATLEPIHLHMPLPHRIARVHRRVHVATAAPVDTAPVADQPVDAAAPAADAPAPPTPARHHRHEDKTQVAAAEPAPDTSGPSSIPFSFGGPAPAPAPKSDQKPPPAAKPVKTASTEPPPAETQAPDEHPAKDADPGLSKRGEILFKRDATDPAPAQLDGLKLLAGDLTSALQAGATRIMLEAFGGAPGDKGSDARRLSLKRALAIRQVLIDDGVPSTKIDVRAMGGIDDKGSTDRVDVFVRAS